MHLLVTGGCGFIGSNFIRHILAAHPDWQVTNLDALTYAGNPANLADIPLLVPPSSLRPLPSAPRYRFARGRVEDPVAVRTALQGCTAVIHFAAESHVDRSIIDPAPFIRTNVLGTQVMLDSARHAQVQRIIYVSTDEIYGTLGREGTFTEQTPLSPRSPYAASKAAADLLCRAWYDTYRLPVTVVRPSNNYGPYQHAEKLIPLAITNLLRGRKVPIYGSGENTRDWLFVEDCCRGIEAALLRGQPGEAYNLGGSNERRNIDVVRAILTLLGRDESAVEYVADRPGHDFRYALDSSKAECLLNWKPHVAFDQGLRVTLDWYRTHVDWWESGRAGSSC
jgi:dTDP-glucose 4,6-dehydratase